MLTAGNKLTKGSKENLLPFYVENGGNTKCQT